MEMGVEMDLSTITMGIDETREIFLLLFRLEEESSQGAIQMDSQDMINLTIFISADPTVDRHLTEKKTLKTITRPHLIVFTSQQSTTISRNDQIFSLHTIKTDAVKS